MALIATVRDEAGVSRTLGVARAVADPDNETAEFAVANPRSDHEGATARAFADGPDHPVCAARGTALAGGRGAAREHRDDRARERERFLTMTLTEDPGVVGFRMALDDFWRAKRRLSDDESTHRFGRFFKFFG